ncbi:uncharacterized protein [Nicotiana sylvestris]|uniref:uncharacterized protein n=1 Tax=Nicotiana sylvestris TaxID=4096 RepID=UPI00388C6E24
MVEEYESDSDIDPEDMRMFEGGFTRTEAREEGPSHILEVPSDFNLLQDMMDLVPQFDLLCSAAENGALQDVSDSELSRGLAAMGLRTYMLEIESACRAEIRAEIFLKMAEKYRWYHNRCREMREQLRAGDGIQSVREELEKRDEELMRSIRRCSELEELLHAKDKELEVGKGISAECEDLQAKVLSLRAELEQNASRVDRLSAEWAEKVVELEKKVAELERADGARVSALARVATLEDTIRVLKFEQESERETATLSLGDRFAALEAKKAQLLAQAPSQEFASSTVPCRLYELWVHAEAQRDIYKGLWEAGSVPEAAFEDARAKEREAHIACGYDPATPEVSEGAEIKDELPSDIDDAGENDGGDDAE